MSKGDDGQSSLWEDSFLKDEQIVTALTEKAVTIRINGGSLEAQYLAAYYPIPVLPAFIIINNGELVVDLRGGESEELFKAAILRALSSRPSQLRSTRTTHPQIPSPEASTTQQRSNDSVPQLSAASPTISPRLTTLNSDPDALSPTARNTSNHPDMPLSESQDVVPAAGVPLNGIHSPNSRASPNGQPSQAVQNLLADRRRRLELEKKKRDAAEKAEQKAKAEARKEAMVIAPDSAKAKQASYAAQQRKRQHEEKLERERILSQIEHDKSERKAKEERRKACAKAQAENTDGAGGLVDQQLAAEFSSPRSTKTKECAVQIRLFDGSTIRSRFSSDQTLRGNVRPWLDTVKSDDIPYTFTQVLTPMPNRILSISEEEDTLQSLGFSPSATLVIVPVQGYTAAYSGGQGIISKGVSVGYDLISTGAGVVSGAFGTFLGLGHSTAPGELHNTHDTKMPVIAETNSTATGTGIHIRTLRDQRNDQDDHQLYNGNQVLPYSLFSIQLDCH